MTRRWLCAFSLKTRFLTDPNPDPLRLMRKSAAFGGRFLAASGSRGGCVGGSPACSGHQQVLGGLRNISGPSGRLSGAVLGPAITSHGDATEEASEIRGALPGRS